ncbi:hypothetical protein AGMMS49593_06720 [Endomicrobiia bacterium]|nr:hypothetical protein AGMMS49593_06720 [Endomicrobiia bacterium]
MFYSFDGSDEVAFGGSGSGFGEDEGDAVTVGVVAFGGDVAGDPGEDTARFFCCL